MNTFIWKNGDCYSYTLQLIDFRNLLSHVVDFWNRTFHLTGLLLEGSGRDRLFKEKMKGYDENSTKSAQKNDEPNCSSEFLLFSCNCEEFNFCCLLSVRRPITKRVTENGPVNSLKLCFRVATLPLPPVRSFACVIWQGSHLLTRAGPHRSSFVAISKAPRSYLRRKLLIVRAKITFCR